jgi:hypothetical protein
MGDGGGGGGGGWKAIIKYALSINYLQTLFWHWNFNDVKQLSHESREQGFSYYHQELKTYR